MLLNLLSATDHMREVKIGEASLYAILGFAIVFVGIALLIFFVWLIGKILVKVNGTNTTKADKPKTDTVKTEVAESLAVAEAADELSDETVAVITAALMAYYQQNNPRCEFTVKRIKRI